MRLAPFMYPMVLGASALALAINFPRRPSLKPGKLILQRSTASRPRSTIWRPKSHWSLPKLKPFHQTRRPKTLRT
jgi:hypothetical protein